MLDPMKDPMYRLRLGRYRGPRGRGRLWRALIKTMIKTMYRALGWRRREPFVIVHYPLSRPTHDKSLISRGTRPE